MLKYEFFGGNYSTVPAVWKEPFTSIYRNPDTLLKRLERYADIKGVPLKVLVTITPDYRYRVTEIGLVYSIRLYTRTVDGFYIYNIVFTYRIDENLYLNRITEHHYKEVDNECRELCDCSGPEGTRVSDVL